MTTTGQQILTLNGGSSSIKFAQYLAGEPLKPMLKGNIERIGLTGTTLSFENMQDNQHGRLDASLSDYKAAASFLLDWLEKQTGFHSIVAAGHRVVHGMQHSRPERITAELLSELRRFSPIDPEHLPGEIELMELLTHRHPALPQVACFDTAFHRNMPRVATLLPLPRAYDDKGVRRYGFHGLSYAYLLEELAKLGDPAASAGRVILAHLGNGASMAAVLEGGSIDTSMGFTPTAGLVMGTRSGDLDPGIAAFLSRTEQVTSEQFYRIASHQSGLLGVSEISSDMQDLLSHQAHDVRAAEAVALFCYQAKKCIGGFAAALGGLDTLVFAGGIGEHAPKVRRNICEGLGFLGIELSDLNNGENAAVISSFASRVTVRVIHTDEERMIARSVCRLLQLR